MRFTLVLAGSKAQFDEWCRQNDGSPANAIYLANHEVLMGRNAEDYDFVTYGTWWERSDWPALGAEIEARGFDLSASPTPHAKEDE